MGNTYGPLGGKRMTVFIDDVSMPRVDELGTQVTCDLLRQLMECGGFCSTDKPGDLINIIDVQVNIKYPCS